MKLKLYDNQYHVTPAREIDLYCHMEGLDPLFVRSTVKMKKDHRAHDNIVNTIMNIIRKWSKHTKVTRLSNTALSKDQLY